MAGGEKSSQYISRVKRMDEPVLTTASLDGITALPDHGADWAAVHVYCRVSDDAGP